ncbi:hypothetical protein [Nocardia gipuzkoensis]|uniref:hypothetical protein n=1 Tax=Nocardia gipuzkoensis TaxID=2749991 RepID=UPI003EE069CD
MRRPPIETSHEHGVPAERGQHAATAPGFAVLMSSVLGVAAMLSVYFDRAPLIGSLTSADQLVWLVIGGIVLSVSLLVWAIKTLYLVGREHRWSWKVIAVPTVVLAGLVAGLVFRPAGRGLTGPFAAAESPAHHTPHSQSSTTAAVHDWFVLPSGLPVNGS